MSKVAAIESEPWGQLSPAMRALPNDRWRAFVNFYVWFTFTNDRKDNYGAQTAAARQAGFGKPKSTPIAMANIASRLMRDERIIAAVVDESRKYLRAGAPEAAKALLSLVRNPEHKDHARAVAMLLDRTDPIVTRQEIDVTHRTVDPDTEAIEELRALRQLGTSRAVLLELFGGNGLARIERLEAADAAPRAQQAKVVKWSR